MTDAPLRDRRAALARLADETWDVLIIGGGITGSGALLDATTRGLKAALIEQEDLAVGTSSRSSRLIHGGLRYLEDLRLQLVREALAERSRLLHLAPHLVRLERFLFPIYGWPLFHRAFMGAGLTLYDLLGAARDSGRAHHLGAGAVAELIPDIRRAGLRGGVTYSDGVEDDARYSIAVALTAVDHGATVATRARVTDLLTDDAGSVTGLRVQDLKLSRGRDENAYNVRLVLVQSLQHDRKVSGDVVLTLTGMQDGAERSYPYAELLPDDSKQEWAFSFRYFQDFDREIVLPDGFVPERIDIEVRSRTRSISGIEQSYSWTPSLG